jgi:hypothetical protein
MPVPVYQYRGVTATRWALSDKAELLAIVEGLKAAREAAAKGEPMTPEFSFLILTPGAPPIQSILLLSGHPLATVRVAELKRVIDEALAVMTIHVFKDESGKIVGKGMDFKAIVTDLALNHECGDFSFLEGKTISTLTFNISEGKGVTYTHEMMSAKQACEEEEAWEASHKIG